MQVRKIFLKNGSLNRFMQRVKLNLEESRYHFLCRGYELFAFSDFSFSPLRCSEFELQTTTRMLPIAPFTYRCSLLFEKVKKNAQKIATHIELCGL